MKQAALGLILSLAILPVAPYAAAGTPAEVVQAFNKALTDRKVDDATAQFAKGSVYYTLRSAHPGVPASTGGVTTDLTAHWKSVAPLLFQVTTSYKRTPKIIDTRVEGELATVWTQVKSETVEPNGRAREDNFSELYLLVRTGGEWKIGAIADNRGTYNISVVPTAEEKAKK